jgi:hypothetical protein
VAPGPSGSRTAATNAVPRSATATTRRGQPDSVASRRARRSRRR